MFTAVASSGGVAAAAAVAAGAGAVFAWACSFAFADQAAEPAEQCCGIWLWPELSTREPPILLSVLSVPDALADGGRR